MFHKTNLLIGQTDKWKVNIKLYLPAKNMKIRVTS